MRRLIWIVLCLLSLQVQANTSKNLAPGFSTRLAASKVLVLPVDMEMFSISAGGVQEPRADWTQDAIRNFHSGLYACRDQLGRVVVLPEGGFDGLAEIVALHSAVAQSVFIHHTLSSVKLATKGDALSWSLGDAVHLLRAKTGADYALFTWVRDTYASSERKAAMAVMAVFGVGLSGGSQIGYASLVDLRDGRIVWFNDLHRSSGDLREKGAALETVETLLAGLPQLLAEE